MKTVQKVKLNVVHITMIIFTSFSNGKCQRHFEFEEYVHIIIMISNEALRA